MQSPLQTSVQRLRSTRFVEEIARGPNQAPFLPDDISQMGSVRKPLRSIDVRRGLDRPRSEGDHPFLHFCVVDDAVRPAKGLQAALDKTARAKSRWPWPM